MAENLWFFDHFHVENEGEENEARSYVNVFEAQMVLKLVKHLVRQGYKPDELAVLTPYLYTFYQSIYFILLFAIIFIDLMQICWTALEAS
jgi:AAA domain